MSVSQKTQCDVWIVRLSIQSEWPGRLNGGFQLEFVSITRVINDMTWYKFECSHCTIAEMISLKGSFLALGARCQSWKLNNSWFFFLVKLTGVTSCLLQFDRIFFCSNNFSNIKCKVPNLKIKIADKRGQLALIS